MNRWLLAASLCAACSDVDSEGGGGGVTTRVATYELPGAVPPKIDIVFVLASAHLQTRGYTMTMSAYGDLFHPPVKGQCIVN